MPKPSLETLNKILAENGKPLLTEIPTGTAGDSDAGNQDTDEGQRDSGTPSGEPVVVSGQAQFSDEDVLKFLAEKGITATSFDDLKPKPKEEDPALLAERREAEKLSFALNRGLINRKDYESFIQDSTDNTQLVFRQYREQALAEDSTLSDEDIVTEFNEKFGIDAEAGSRKHKRGQEEINTLADRLLKNRYSKVYEIDSAYDRFEAEQNTKKSETEKILKAAPLYKRDVEEVFSSLGKMTYTIDGQPITVDVPQEAISSVKQMFLDQQTSVDQIKKGWTKDTLKKVAELSLTEAAMNSLMEQVAKQYLLKKQAGTRGIVPIDSREKRAPGKELTENMKKVLADAGIKIPESAN